jgi:hypothetical protein
VHAGAPERIDAQPDLRGGDGGEVDHVAEVGHVRVEVVVAVRRRCAQRLGFGDALDAREPRFEQPVRRPLDRRRDVAASRAAVSAGCT